MIKQGASHSDLDWFIEHNTELQFVGINLYPMFSRKILSRTAGRLRMRMPYSSANIVEQLGDLYWDRYQIPLFIAETASVGSVKRRRQWLAQSVEAVQRLRVRGVPMVGYTWWPLFALVTWGYRQGTRPPEFYLKQMGLWDFDSQLNRVETDLVPAYRELVANGSESVAPLAQHDERIVHVS